MSKDIYRCPWSSSDPIYIDYHDKEWGVPLHGDQKLFEAVILDGAQAGLSWITILKRREGYRKAFKNFDIKLVSKFDDNKVSELLGDVGIIRNKLKILSAIKNAQSALEIQKEFGSFDKYMWQFVNNKPIQHKFSEMSEIPVVNPEAEAMSKDLKKRGFGFVGPTICYALMQACGMVNDHMVDCFRYYEVVKLGGR